MSNTLNGIPILEEDANTTQLLLGNILNTNRNSFTGIINSGLRSGFPQYERNWNKPINQVSKIDKFKTDKQIYYGLSVLVFKSGAELLKKYEELKTTTLLTPTETYNGYFLLESSEGNNLFNTLFLCAFGDAFRNQFLQVYNGGSTITAKLRKDNDLITYEQPLNDAEGVVNYFFDFVVYDSKVHNTKNKLPAFKKFVKMVELDLGNYVFEDNGFSWTKYITGVDETIANSITDLAHWVDQTFTIDKKRYIYKPPDKYNPLINIDAVGKGIDALSQFSKNIAAQFNQYKTDFEALSSKLDSLNIIGNFGTKVKNVINNLITTFTDVANAVSNFLTEIKDDIVSFLQIVNAIICGILNGLVSLISSVLKLIAFLVDWVVGPLLSLDTKVDEPLSTIIASAKRNEAIEDMIDLFTDNWAEIKKGILSIFTEFSFSDLQRIIVAAYNKMPATQIAYYAGNFIFEVVSGVLLTIFTGGAGALLKAKGFAEKIIELFKLVAKESFETATFGVLNIATAIKMFFEQFLKKAALGGKHLYNWFIGLLQKLFSDGTPSLSKLAKHEDAVVKTKKLSTRQVNAKRRADEKKKKQEKILAEKAFESERRVADLFDGLGGRKLTSRELKLLKKKLKSVYNVDLRLIDKEKGQKLPVTNNGQTEWIPSEKLLQDWNKRNVVGKFHEGPPPVMILRSNNATELTVFHEKVHLEVWYKKLPKMHIVDEEKLVFEEIFKARHKFKWTDDELIDAYDYVNKKVNDWNDLGKSFSKLHNDVIEQIKINKQLNIK